MAVEDAYQTRRVQRELTRRYVDCSRIDVKVIHGVCYLSGLMRQLRSHPYIDLDQEAEIIQKTIRQIPGIRQVIWDVRLVKRQV